MDGSFIEKVRRVELPYEEWHLDEGTISLDEEPPKVFFIAA